METTNCDIYQPNILLLVNEEDDVITLNPILQRTGLDVHTDWLSTVGDFARGISEMNPDLIIADYNLQDGTALDALSVLQKQRRPIPVIVVSNHISDGATKEAMAAGVKDVVNKADFKHLIAAVSKELIDIDRQRERDKLTNRLYEVDQQRRDTEEALQQLKKSQNEASALLTQLHNIIESSVDGIRVIDSDFNVLRTSSRYLGLAESGAERASANGKCFELTPRPECHTDACQLIQIINGQSPPPVEIQVGSGPTRKDLLLSCTPLKDESGQVQGIVEYLRDVTKQKAIQRQMLQSQKMESIGQLAAGIAHEINTPTQFVGDNLNFLDDSFSNLQKILETVTQLVTAAAKVPTLGEFVEKTRAAIDDADLEYLSEEIPQALAQSKDGISRITSIVKAMKEFSHPGSEEAQLFSVNQNIQNTVTVARNEWKYVSRVDMEFGYNLPKVKGYPGEFNQTILNMIVNASHAIEEKNRDTGNKGIIQIITACENDQVIIKIRDTGAGIPKEVVDRIFDPFFTTKAVGKGTGQGLAIAHSAIVDKHQGTIEVESTPGEGTLFTITLPAATGSEDQGVVS